MAAKRTYIADLPGGTATTTVQMTESGTLTGVIVSFLSTAAGKIEVSRSATSQIGTAQPTRDVIARLNCSATAGNVVTEIPLKQPVKILENIYIHQTGAGNLGSVTFMS